MNTLLQETPEPSTPRRALEQLNRYIEKLAQRTHRIESLEGFEREVHQLIVEVEQEILVEGLSQLDIEAPVVEVDGQIYRHVYRGEKNYLSAAGEIRVERSLYRVAQGKAICPLELQAGIVDGYWTPLAARQGVWVTAQLPPAEGAALFRELGSMVPSKSSLDRLCRELGEQWEGHREEFEATLCAQITIPEEAVSVSASLDGVMVPMKRPAREPATDGASEDQIQPTDKSEGPPGQSDEVQTDAQAKEQSKKKPFYREASCATLSFYDASGQRLETIRFARMPEPGKRVLKSQLSEAVATVLGQGSELRLIKLADGAKDNWRFLSQILQPDQGEERVDFFHACDHLSNAFEVGYGKSSTKARGQYQKYRTVLLEQENGVEKVIRALAYLKRKHPRRKKLAKELNYFRNNRHRMHYARARLNKLPIGSGVTEAACKTLVTQRLKCSGMRWKTKGGQGVLTVRGLIQSNRFDSGWRLLSGTYRQVVSMPPNVLLLNGKNR